MYMYMVILYLTRMHSQIDNGAPSQIPKLVANVANSMMKEWTCFPTPLP